jgi:hypothetical protein
MFSSSGIWLISIGWCDATYIDFLARSSSQLTTKLDIYHWFFSHIHDKILQFDYSPLDNIEGDLDLSQIFNRNIEHENLNINDFEDFIQLSLGEIELFMRENGKAHGMFVTVNHAKQQNYEIINVDDDPLTPIWKVTYNPRYLDCISLNNYPNLYDLQQTTRSNYLWQIRAKEQHTVYEYIFRNLNKFNRNNLPKLMNKTEEELIKMVELPLEQTEHQILTEMINIQCCQIQGQHEHSYNEQEKYFICVEPSLDLLNILDI